MKSRPFSFVQSLRTDIGKVRKENQDSYAAVIADDWILLVVCDGMGGTKGGSVASILAVEVILKRLSPESQMPNIASVQRAMEEANAVLHTYGKQHEGFEEMGTTALVFFCGPASCFVAHVGDSRLYRMRKGTLEQLTRDHTWVQELVDSGAMEASNAEKSPVSHLLTRAFGTREDVEIEIRKLEHPQEGDFYFLCSDGLYGSVSQEEMSTTASTVSASTVDETVEALLDRALDSGGKDNITVAGLYIVSSQKKSQKKDSSTGKSLPPVRMMVSGKSGIDIDQLLYEIDDTANPLLDIADETSREVSPELLSGKSTFHQNTSFISFFVFGIFLSVVVMLFIAVQKQEPLQYAEDVSQVSESIIDEAGLARLNEVRAAVEQRKAFEVSSVFSVSPSPFSEINLTRSYFDDVSRKFYTLSSEAPHITLPVSQKLLPDERPVRPIVWEHEEERIERFRKGSGAVRQIERKRAAPAPKKETFENSEEAPVPAILSTDEIHSVIEEKELLRSRIADTDEKILQLSLRSIEERDILVKDLHLKVSILNDELLEIRQEDERLHRQVLHLKTFMEEVELGNFMQIAERLLPFEPALEVSIKHIRRLEREVGNTRRVLERTDDEIALANKLSTLMREKGDTEVHFQAKLRALIEKRINTVNIHRSLLKYLVHVLTFQRNASVRAVGYLNAYTELGGERARELLRNLTEERDSLYSQFSILQKMLSDSDEIKHNRVMYLKMAKLDY